MKIDRMVHRRLTEQEKNYIKKRALGTDQVGFIKARDELSDSIRLFKTGMLNTS